MFDEWHGGPITDASGPQLTFGGSIFCLGLAILLYRVTEAALDLLTLALVLAGGCFTLTAILAERDLGIGGVLTPFAAGFLALAFFSAAIGVTLHQAVGQRVASLIFAAAFWCFELGLVVFLARDLLWRAYPLATEVFGVVVALPLILRAFVQPGRKAALGFLIMGITEAASVGAEIQDRSAVYLAQGAVVSIVCLTVAYGLRRPQPPGVVILMSLLDNETTPAPSAHQDGK